MLVKLHLHGHLKDKVQQSVVEVEGTTLMDVLKNFELRYRKILKAPLDIGKWKIRVKDFDTQESWNVPLFVNDIHIYPVFKMGKSSSSSGWVQIGIGTLLLVGVFCLPGVGAAMAAMSAGAFSFTGAAGMMALSMGIGMVAQGLLTLLFPQPTPDTADNDSKYLGSGQNTVKSGTRIPFGYGRYKLAGQILSYNVSSSNLRIYGE